MPYLSAPGDLALHGVRVLGFPAAARVAARYGLDAGTVEEALLDFEARGWVRYLSFGGTAGWSLTDSGRTENERRLAAELGRVDGHDRDSCHIVWIQFHEDLLATLGIPRGTGT